MTKLHKIKIELDSDQKFGRLMPIGDIHYGHKDHDSEMFEIYMDWIYDNKDVYVIGMADLVEGATKDSIGYYDQTVNINDQIDYIVEKFEPLVEEGRLVGLLEGNHERRTKRASGVDLNRQIAKHLGARNLGVGAAILFRVVRSGRKRGENYKFYASHGSTGATTAGGRINACMKFRDIINAECYLMGHAHTLEHHKQSIYDFKYNDLIVMEKHFVITGSYLLYLGSYAQEKGYPPSGTSGSPKIKLHVDLHRISVSL